MLEVQHAGERLKAAGFVVSPPATNQCESSLSELDGWQRPRRPGTEQVCASWILPRSVPRTRGE